MKTYRIFENQEGDIRAVREGWSYTAFFLIGVWSLFKGLYLYGVVSIFILIVALMVMPGSILSLNNTDSEFLKPIVGFIVFAMQAYFGIKGNDLVMNRLRKKGYDFQSSITSHSAEAAISRYKEEGNQ